MRNEDGVAMVEFAIILPVLMILLFGGVQFGTFYGKSQSIADATRVAARLAAVCRTTLVDPTQAGKDAAKDLKSPAFTFNPSGAGSKNCSIPPNTQVTVVGTAESTPIRLPFLNYNLIPKSTIIVVEE